MGTAEEEEVLFKFQFCLRVAMKTLERPMCFTLSLSNHGSKVALK